MLVRHSVDQNTDDWLKLRAGKVTGSAIAKVMANFGKAFGEPAKVYAANVAVERLTKKNIESTFCDDHMARGHEQEPLARVAYEEKTFCEVEDGAFWTNGNRGSSPDGLVGETGIIEIKCVTPGVHYRVIKKDSFASAYKWQMLFNTWLLEREWCDFVSYCSDFPKDSRVHVHRLHLADFTKEVQQIETRILQFEDLVGETIEIIQGAG